MITAWEGHKNGRLFTPLRLHTTVICHDKYSLQYVRSCLQRWTEVAWVEALNQSFFFFFLLLQPEINDQEVEWGEFLYRILTGQELCLSITHTTKLPLRFSGQSYPELSKTSCASPKTKIPLLFAMLSDIRGETVTSRRGSLVASLTPLYMSPPGSAE